MNDPAQLLSLFISGVLGRSGRKRARRAARFVSGNKGLITASGVLAAAGVAWGVYDSLKATGTVAGTAPATAGAAGPLPPLPPPIPGSAAPASAEPATMPADVLRIVRLGVSAARADGVLAPAERALILEQARRAGVEAEAGRELDHPHPLADIVGGVSDEAARRDLYVLAYTIVRADEAVSGAERIYLAQLAHHLGLDAGTAARLESETASRIDAGVEEDGRDP